MSNKILTILTLALKGPEHLPGRMTSPALSRLINNGRDQKLERKLALLNPIVDLKNAAKRNFVFENSVEVRVKELKQMVWERSQKSINLEKLKTQVKATKDSNANNFTCFNAFAQGILPFTGPGATSPIESSFPRPGVPQEQRNRKSRKKIKMHQMDFSAHTPQLPTAPHPQMAWCHPPAPSPCSSPPMPQDRPSPPWCLPMMSAEPRMPPPWCPWPPPALPGLFGGPGFDGSHLPHPRFGRGRGAHAAPFGRGGAVRGWGYGSRYQPY